MLDVGFDRFPDVACWEPFEVPSSEANGFAAADDLLLAVPQKEVACGIKCLKRFRFALLAVFDHVARTLFHRFEPSVNLLLFFNSFDLRGESFEGHAVNAGRVVALDELLIAVIVRRPEEFSSYSAAVDHLEITLGRVDFDLFDVEELVEMVCNDVADCLLFRLEGEVAWHRVVKLRGFAAFGALGRDHDDVAVGFFQEQVRDIKQLIRPCAGAQAVD